MNKNKIENKSNSIEVSVAISEKKLESQIKKSRIIRSLYIIGGTLSLALAIIGIIVPGLPTTPFALLSAYLYAKSSDRLYNWLLNNKILGSDRKSTRLNSSHVRISYAVFCLKKKMKSFC